MTEMVHPDSLLHQLPGHEPQDIQTRSRSMQQCPAGFVTGLSGAAVTSQPGTGLPPGSQRPRRFEAQPSLRTSTGNETRGTPGKRVTVARR